MRTKMLVTLALAGALVMGLSAPVSSGAPLATPTVSPSAGPPGTVITISGSGCHAGIFDLGDQHAGDVRSGTNGPILTVTVTVQFVPTPVTVETTADHDGNWSVQVTVPADAQPGPVAVNATCHDPFAVGAAEGDFEAAQTSPGTYPPGTFTVTAAATQAVEAAPTSVG